MASQQKMFENFVRRGYKRTASRMKRTRKRINAGRSKAE